MFNGSARTRARTLTLAIVVAAATVLVPVADAQQSRGKSLDALCQAFLRPPATLPHDARITGREIREESEIAPKVCIIRGEIVTSPESTINWVVELPHPADWNGKTLTVGGGGTDGFIPTDDPFYQQLMGPSSWDYVRMSSDSGHQQRTFYPWPRNDDALRNHGYRANHMTLAVGTYLATRFNHEAPARRYMIGHSNGGRSGLVSAQRYPGDYDGVIARAPAISQQAHQTGLAELHKHVFGAPENWLSREKIALFAEAETAACDGLDGIEDGIIGQLAACDYDGADLLCQGEETDSCLTAGQLESIRLIYTDHAGEFPLHDNLTRGYPRFGRGGGSTSDWGAYVFGSGFDARDSFNFWAADDAAKTVTGEDDASIMTIDPADYAAEYQRLSAELDPGDHDLSAFAANGGKLLISHGLADACVSVHRTAEYVESVKRHTNADVRDFARMVTSPGVGHNLDGPGAGAIDLLAVMESWVERAAPPDNLVASKYPGGPFDYDATPEFQRPLCEWPTFPRYDGDGDPAKAKNFYCAYR